MTHKTANALIGLISECWVATNQHLSHFSSADLTSGYLGASSSQKQAKAVSNMEVVTVR